MRAGSSRMVRRNVLVLAGALTLTGGLLLDQSAARADPFGGFGGIIGGFMGGAPPGYYYKHQRRTYGPPRGSPAAAPPPSPAESSRALAALAPPSTQDQIAMLK